MSAGQALAVANTAWQTEDAKKAFAKALLFDPSEPYKAAKSVLGNDPSKAIWASDFWVNDPVVIAEQKALIELHGELYFLPNKAEVARRVFEESKTAKTSSERQAAYKLYATLMGFMDEGRTLNQNNTYIGAGAGGDNRVMVVTTHGTDAQWEDKAKSQQAALVESAQADIERDEAELMAESGDDGVWNVEAKRA